MLKEARATKDKIVSDAKAKAEVEYAKILASAKEDIRNEKLAAITELKHQVADLSIHIAEKVIREELSADEKQQALVNKYLEEAKLN